MQSNTYSIIKKVIWLPALLVMICSNLPAQKKTTVTLQKILKYLNQEKWNELFPNRFDISTHNKKAVSEKRTDFYSFNSFLSAADSFPQFLDSEDTVLQKRELSAFLASMAYETGGGWETAPGGYYRWGLYFTEEKKCENGCPAYSDTGKLLYPPVAGQSYHGRGPLQISWNYNYAQFSENYFHDKNRLLKNPALVATDPVISFASAFWFWTAAQYPKPSCHEIITGLWKPSPKDTAAGRVPGFGAVMNVINGGLECGGNTTAGHANRLGYYLFFCRVFNVPPGENTDCASQKPFGQ